MIYFKHDIFLIPNKTSFLKQKSFLIILRFFQLQTIKVFLWVSHCGTFCLTLTHFDSQCLSVARCGFWWLIPAHCGSLWLVLIHFSLLLHILSFRKSQKLTKTLLQRNTEKLNDWTFSVILKAIYLFLDSGSFYNSMLHFSSERSN